MEAKLGVEKLNNENYQQWAFETEMLLIREDLWKFVDFERVPNPVPDEWTRGVQRARATISLLVERRQHPLIRELKTAREVWLKLKNMHQKTTMCSRVSLICQVCDRKLPEGGDVAAHVYELEELFARLRNAGKDLGEDVEVAILLRSLPMSYDQVRTALLILKDEDLKMDYVKSKILDHERKMNEAGESGESVVAYKTVQRRKLICYGCGKEGHRKVDCPADTSDDDAELRRSYAFVMKTGKWHDWIVDSGATSHVCSVKTCFETLKPAPRETILLANGKEVDVQGIGTISVKSVDNNGEQTVLKLSEVLYVTGLEVNLISVGKLVEKGADVRFSKHGCRIYAGKETAAVAVLRGGLYRLKQRDWRSRQRTSPETHFVGVVINNLRRKKKIKRKEIIGYTLGGFPEPASPRPESAACPGELIQEKDDVVDPVYIFRASTRRSSKRKCPVQRSGVLRDSKARRVDTSPDQDQMSTIQEELENLSIGTDSAKARNNTLKNT